jgi:hypothetical protein
MNNPRILGPVPDLGAKRQKPPELTHFVVAVELAGELFQFDYLCTAVGVDPMGNVAIIMNGVAVGGYAAGTWKEWRRADLQPSEPPKVATP